MGPRSDRSNRFKTRGAESLWPPSLGRLKCETTIDSIKVVVKPEGSEETINPTIKLEQVGQVALQEMWTAKTGAVADDAKKTAAYLVQAFNLQAAETKRREEVETKQRSVRKRQTNTGPPEAEAAKHDTEQAKDSPEEEESADYADDAPLGNGFFRAPPKPQLQAHAVATTGASTTVLVVLA